MKRIILALLLIANLDCWSQCSECTSLEEAFEKPKKVITLKINPFNQNITLDEVSKRIGTLENIEILYLTDHNIKKIPKEIKNLKKIIELSFAGCKLVKIPDEIFQLKSLKEVILYDN